MNVLRSALIALALFALQSIAFGQSADESAKPPDGRAKQDEVGTGSGDANSEAPFFLAHAFLGPLDRKPCDCG